MSDELDDHEGVGSLLGAPADPGGWAQVPAADEPLPTTEEDAVARERGDRGLSDGDIARSSVVMAAGTLASRVLGVARNTLTAAVVGATGVLAADAWNVANTLPNIIHLLLAGGILNAVIVPQIARAMKAEDGGTAYVNRLLTLGLTILAGATVVLTAASPLLVALYVDPGWPSGATALATTFAFICVPQVFFYGMYTLLGQVLNAAGRFGAFMWAPALANVVALAGLAWFYLTDQPFQAPVDQWSPTMIAVLGVGIFYVFVSWMAIAGTGPQQSIELAQDPNTSSEIFFGPVRSTYGEWAITLFNILLVTGSFACGMAFHNCASRYLYAMSREGLHAGLQKTLGATHPHHGSPHIASFVQTGITLVLILAFFFAGMDPYVHMYTLLAILGTMAILIVQALCAFSVVAYLLVPLAVGDGALAPALYTGTAPNLQPATSTLPGVAISKADGE